MYQMYKSRGLGVLLHPPHNQKTPKKEAAARRPPPAAAPRSASSHPSPVPKPTAPHLSSHLLCESPPPVWKRRRPAPAASPIFLSLGRRLSSQTPTSLKLIPPSSLSILRCERRQAARHFLHRPRLPPSSRRSPTQESDRRPRTTSPSLGLLSHPQPPNLQQPRHQWTGFTTPERNPAPPEHLPSPLISWLCPLCNIYGQNRNQRVSTPISVVHPLCPLLTEPREAPALPPTVSLHHPRGMANGSEGGLGIPMDNYESLMATTDVELLKTAWCNEKAAPEILQFHADLVQRSREQIELMEDTVEEFTKSGFDPLIVSIYQMDLDRAQFLLRSYLRIRLQKIEKDMLYISKTDLWNRLSREEQKFARRCYEDMKNYLDESFLSKLPSGYQSNLKQSNASEEDDMVPQPCLDTFVFCKSKGSVGAVALDESGDEIVDLVSDDLYVLRYKSVKPFLDNGQIDLV